MVFFGSSVGNELGFGVHWLGFEVHRSPPDLEGGRGNRGLEVGDSGEAAAGLRGGATGRGLGGGRWRQ